jgi:hypothetical protein
VLLSCFYVQYTKYIYVICYVFVSVRYFLFTLTCPIDMYGCRLLVWLSVCQLSLCAYCMFVSAFIPLQVGGVVAVVKFV